MHFFSLQLRKYEKKKKKNLYLYLLNMLLYEMVFFLTWSAVDRVNTEKCATPITSNEIDTCGFGFPSY